MLEENFVPAENTSALDDADWSDVLQTNEEGIENDEIDENEDDDDFEFDEDDDDDDFDDEEEDDFDDEDEEDEDEDDDFEEDEDDEEEIDYEEPKKRVQTKEENAYYAELRRQKQFEERLQQTNEYRITQMLANQYGITPEEVLAQLEKAQIAREAQQQGVPVHVMERIQQQERQAQYLQDQIQRMEFERWYSEREYEAQEILERYNGVLTQEDVNDTLSFMLNQLGTTTLGLDQAVRLLHGDKLESHLKRVAKQEALAEFSGRKNAPLPSHGVKTAHVDGLTDEERYIAKQLGMSEKQYAQYK